MDYKKHRIINKLFILAFVILTFLVRINFRIIGSIKGLLNRTFQKPVVIRTENFIDLDEFQNQNKEKEEFFIKYKTKNGFYGLKQKRITIEGTYIYVYVATQNGLLTYIIDYTYDAYGIRKYLNYYPSKVLLGFFDDKKNFIEIDSNTHTPGGSNLRLKFFYQSKDMDEVVAII